MLRLVSVVRRAVPRVAAAAAPRALVAPRALLHSAVMVRAGARQTAVEEAETEEEERAPLSVADARRNLSDAMTKEGEGFGVGEEDFAGEYATQNGLTVKVDVATETVLATRETEGHKIQIVFRSDILETPPEEEGGATDEEKLPEHRFIVDIRAPSGKIMRLECFNSDKGELEVGDINFPAEVSADLATAPRLSEEAESEAARGALRVEELTEEASQALFDYLESIQVDDDLAMWVSSQAQQVRTQGMIARIANLKAFVQ